MSDGCLTIHGTSSDGYKADLEAHRPDSEGRIVVVLDDGNSYGGTGIALGLRERFSLARFLWHGRHGFGWGDPAPWDEEPKGAMVGDYCRIGGDSLSARYLGAGLGLAVEGDGFVVDRVRTFDASHDVPVPTTLDVAHYARVVELVRESMVEKGWSP